MINFDDLTYHLDLSKKIYVGYSGGPDSTALLHLLYLNNIANIEAIHINHNISDNSLEWEEHCRKTSEKLGIKCHLESVKVKTDGDGLESAARKARYKIFTKYLKKDEQILLGHHSNDAAETFLLRLFRGTGLDGLESLRVKRKVGEGYLIRPLINVSKESILFFLKEKKISFVKDESNSSQDHDRNYVRNTIIPSIEKRWANVSSRISNTSNFIKIRNDSYEMLFEEKYDHLIGDKIPVNALKKIQKPFLVDVIRFSIKKQNIAMPSKKVIEQILKTFIESNPGPKSEVSWTRADKEQSGGKIFYKDKCVVITKK